MSDKSAHKYRLAQVKKILAVFAQATGRAPKTMGELDARIGSPAGRAALAYDRRPDGTIVPDYE